MAYLLIIDDDVNITTQFERALKPEGFEVFTANSGLEGIEAARELEPDVILLDLMMPGVDGWQVCKAIRTFSRVPILVISAVIDSQLVMRSLAKGADDYLVKPVPFGVLVSHLNNLIRRSARGAVTDVKGDE